MMENKQVLNLQRVKQLEVWLKSTNTKLVQVNGQRKYGGPPEGWAGPPPGPRCEVFISQIPRDAYEDQLLPAFRSAGPLWEFRLMMNFSGQNRGFAYAKYGSPAAAANAIRMLNNHLLEDGARLSVRRSTEKRRLCLGHLPADTRREALLQVLRGLTEGVERVSLQTGPGIEGVTAVVAFSSHHAASMAKKVLVEAFKKRYSLSVSIWWQAMVKPSLDWLPPLATPLPLAPPPPLAMKPPRHLRRSSRPAEPLPPPVAVGGASAPSLLPPPPPSLEQAAAAAVAAAPMASPMALLCLLCEGAGYGPPLDEMFFSHAGADGRLCFTYRLSVPGLSAAFEGVVTVSPGASAAAVLEDARRSAAQQVVERLYQLVQLSQ